MKTIIIALLLLLMVSPEVTACGCKGSLGMADATHVFEGEVIEIKRFDSIIIYYEIIFKTTKKVKGDLPSEDIIVLVPSLNEAVCGIPFELKEKYIVYTYLERLNGKLRAWTNLCTETTKIP